MSAAEKVYLEELELEELEIEESAQLWEEEIQQDPGMMPEETQDQQESVNKRKKKSKWERTPFVAKLLVLGFMAVGAVGFLVTAMDSSRVYTVRQELALQKAQLQNAKEQTTILQNELDNHITLTELYDYATDNLHMKETEKEDVIYLPALDMTQSGHVSAMEADHNETKISFHLFG